MGSVKDLEILRHPSGNSPGRGRFIFSDRYSAFDWGEMPDHIPDKGKAICIAAAFYFEKLEERGIASHYVGLIEEGAVKRLRDLKAASSTMEFQLLRVVEPCVVDGGYDYAPFHKERLNFLIPLEIIYRNSLPAGSSVFRRLKEGSLKLEDIGLEGVPEPGQLLEETLFDVSTKLESSDRYLTWEEACRISGLSEAELEEIQSVTKAIDDQISVEAARLGLVQEDGKVEFGFDDERRILLLDTVGTLDECRFTYEGMPVSKEIARIFYRETEWYREVEEAKQRDLVNWKILVKEEIPLLPPELKEAIADLYRAYADELTGVEWFGAPPLRESLRIIGDALRIA
ncbi:MAG: phosphoribosylaminoimidazolesuccinocarboxamide synthase [Candidatus Solincola sediminis]|nr:MAG: phosphoribosylaminoimidazolesuccinocarboxamide synthase [Candidatus Solincola sediminis]